MKNAKYLAAAAMLALPLALSACGPKPDPKDMEMPVPPIENTGRERSVTERRSPYDLSGSYTVEYVHYSAGAEKDDTLDYRLDLSNDNTYTMSVVTDGIKAEHYGRWYVTGSNVALFFDEPIVEPPHNVFVGDSMYLELIPGGKMMVFEGSKVIVLARDSNDGGVMIAPSRS